jgi:hypothetical protein
MGVTAAGTYFAAARGGETMMEPMNRIEAISCRILTRKKPILTPKMKPAAMERKALLYAARLRRLPLWNPLTRWPEERIMALYDQLRAESRGPTEALAVWGLAFEFLRKPPWWDWKRKPRRRRARGSIRRSWVERVDE